MDDKLNDVLTIGELTTCLKIPKSPTHPKNSWHWRFRAKEPLTFGLRKHDLVCLVQGGDINARFSC